MMPGEPGSDLISTMVKDNDGTPHVISASDPGCDVLVLQRPLHYNLAEIIPQIQKHGVRVVIELDDDFENIHPQNIAYKGAHPRYSPERNWKFLRQACELADAMVVSTPALQRYKPDAVTVVPNFVPERYLQYDYWTTFDTLGWSGSIDTHPGDLRVVGNSVARLVNQDTYRLRVVGTGKGVAEAFGVSADNMQTTGWVDIEDYPDEMRRVGIGVVPLIPSPFNEAKSWLKGLEWASLGVPFVASPTAEYAKLKHMYGIGEIAVNPKEWAKKVSSLHHEDGHHNRNMVDKHDLVIERQASLWYNAWVGETR